MSVGVPLAKGLLQGTEGLLLSDAAGRSIRHGARVLSRWSDGSARWVLIETLASAKPGEQVSLSVSTNGESSDPPEPPASDHYHCAGLTVSLEPDPAQLLAMPALPGPDAGTVARSRFELIGADDQPLAYCVVSRRWIDRDTRHSATLETILEPADRQGSCAPRVLIRQTVFANAPLSRVQLTLHNPDAAVHPGGLWDLGDPGSLLFRACAIVIEAPDGSRISWQLNAADQWQAAGDEPLSITQGGSGGEHWDSPVHVDAHGNRGPAFRGYEIEKGSARVAAGNRCAPALRVQAGAAHLALRPEHFWQCFPKALRVKDRHCRLELFPAFADTVHELQGGESTTSVFYLDFGGSADALDWVDRPLQVSLDAASVFASEALADWHHEQADERYAALLERSVSGEHAFVHKREAVDEFGWRHFGELYADHETWNQAPTGIFVSHYNNQYDVVFGFARQYLQTGDARWFVLMRDLARHVLDIDLYRTDADRPEYNQGLFWHTDHYVQAHTATHRTYSRHQNPEHPEHTGGGPGGQHCYTSGLRLYHQITGDDRARQAVFDLARWIGIVYEGSGSVLEQARVSLQRDLPALLKLIKGKTVLRYRYPLDRGVGNYIRALLDCFEIDGEREHLDRAGAIIRATIGPADVIEERDLSDIEGTWFYTVLLQAVVSFLDARRQAGLLDAHFHYARNALLHYARWMAEHERPYLDSADRLEYPNDTWVAQDARKASVLHAAYRYALDDREPLLAKATEFREYVVDHLERSDTVHYTRIQAILLQNHGPTGDRWSALPAYAIDVPSAPDEPGSHATIGSLARSSASTWWHCLRSFSLRRETAWLKHRLPQRANRESFR